jgi:hypothetical protein
LQDAGLVPVDAAQGVLLDGLPGTREGISGGGEITGLQLVISTVQVMLFTLALMLPVSWVFMSARRANFDQAVVQTLLTLPLVVAGVVMVVQTSIALAFALTGIVAALRIRTTIRDVRDLVYLFSGIGVGIAVAVHALVVATVLSVTFNVVVLLIWRYDFGRRVLEPSASAQWSGPLRGAPEVYPVGKEIASARSETCPGFVVGAYEQRQRTPSLHDVELLGGLDWRPDGHDDSANAIDGDKPLDPEPGRGVVRSEVAEDLRPHQLCRPVSGRQRSQNRIRPRRVAHPRDTTLSASGSGRNRRGYRDTGT